MIARAEGRLLPVTLLPVNVSDMHTMAKYATLHLMIMVKFSKIALLQSLHPHYFT